MNETKEIAIVYLVAGISSRFGGIKQFAQVGPNGESLIEYSLNQALPAGFSSIYFIVGNTTEKPFRERFGDSYRGVPIFYAVQRFDTAERERPWGTTDALTTLKGRIECPFVICNGDNLYGEGAFKILFEHLQHSDDEATIGYVLDNVLPEKGICNRAMYGLDDGYVKSLREMLGLERGKLPQGINLEDLCSKNIFGFHPRIIDMFDTKIQKFKEKYKGDRRIEYILPNTVSELIEEGKIKLKIYHANGECLDITRIENVEEVRRSLQNLKKS